MAKRKTRPRSPKTGHYRRIIAGVARLWFLRRRSADWATHRGTGKCNDPPRHRSVLAELYNPARPGMAIGIATRSFVRRSLIATQGDRSVVGGDILQRRPSFKAARFIAPPFFLAESARRRRLRRRRAKNESAALARRGSASITGARKNRRATKSRPPCYYAANGGSSVSGPLLSSVRGTMLAERSKATRAAAFTLPTPPRDV